MDRHGPRDFGMGGGPMRMHGMMRGGFRGGRGGDGGGRDGPPEPSNKLFVGNLPQDIPPEKVKSMFGAYGRVTECDIITNYAFVHFDSIDDARAAKDSLHQKELGGNRIRVEFSSSKARGRSGGPREGVTCFKCGTPGHLANECRGPPSGPRGDSFGPMGRGPRPDQPLMMMGGPMRPPHMQGLPRQGPPNLGPPPPRPGGPPPPGPYGPDPRQDMDYQRYLRDRVPGAPSIGSRGPAPPSNGAAADQARRYKPYDRPSFSQQQQPATSAPSYPSLASAPSNFAPAAAHAQQVSSLFGAGAPSMAPGLTASHLTAHAALTTATGLDPYAAALAAQQPTAGAATLAAANPYAAATAMPATTSIYTDPYQAAAAAAAASPSDPYGAAAAAYQAAVAALAAAPGAAAAGTPGVVPGAVPTAMPGAVHGAMAGAVPGALAVAGGAPTAMHGAMPGTMHAGMHGAPAAAGAVHTAASLVAMQAGAYSAAGYTDPAQEYYRSAAAAAGVLGAHGAQPAAPLMAPVPAPASLAAPAYGQAAYGQDNMMAAALAAANPYAAYQ